MRTADTHASSDVMDRRFVPNIAIGPDVVRAIRRVARVPLDVHLMITEPDRYIEEFAAAAATIAWERYVGAAGAIVGMHTFGASARLKALQQKYGFTPERLADEARAHVARAGAHPAAANELT